MTNKFKTILIFGAPGSGKGTVSKVLAATGLIYHVSSGDIFRGLSPESHAGKLFFQYAHKGLLVPDKETIEIWKSRMDELVHNKVYQPEKQWLLLDGIPRTKQQAEEIKYYADIQKIIVLDCHEKEVLIERLKKRALIEGRADDAKEEILKQRMDVYEKQTHQVLDVFRHEIQCQVNALQPQLIVLRDILKLIATDLS